MTYAFDTNTVIQLMRGLQSVKVNREKAQKNGARFIIPPIVNYEVRRGLIIKPIPANEKAYAIFHHNFEIYITWVFFVVLKRVINGIRL